MALASFAPQSNGTKVRQQRIPGQSNAWLAVAWDGRIDDRQVLSDTLRNQRVDLGSGTDADLILAAYEAWGKDFPAHILGDFVFAIWDGLRRCLICGRDVFGIKPLYYTAAPTGLLFASEIGALLADPDVQREPNEAMVRPLVLDENVDNESTLFKNILKLPPGHLLICQKDSVGLERYWQPAAVPELRYKTDEDYAAHFRELMETALRDRVRGADPVAVELGGLDSSVLVGLAAQLARREAGVPEVRAYSVLFPGWSCDEQPYIDAVMRASRVPGSAQVFQVPQQSYFEEQVAQYGDLPDYPNNAFLDPLRAVMRRDGVRVVLTGSGADEWLWAPNLKYADLLGSFALKRWLRHFLADSAKGLSLRDALSASIGPLLPNVQRFVRRARGTAKTPPWLGPVLAALNIVPDQAKSWDGGKHDTSRMRTLLYHTATSGIYTHHLEMDEREGARHGLEVRHPYYDRRVVEFCLALPLEQRERGPYTKFILRNVARNLLPAEVVDRATKVDHSRTFYVTLQAAAEAGAFEKLAIANVGWVCSGEVRAMYRQMIDLYARNDSRWSAHAWILWKVLAIEWWWKRYFSTNV